MGSIGKSSSIVLYYENKTIFVTLIFQEFTHFIHQQPVDHSSRGPVFVNINQVSVFVTLCLPSPVVMENYWTMISYIRFHPGFMSISRKLFAFMRSTIVAFVLRILVGFKTSEYSCFEKEGLKFKSPIK